METTASEQTAPLPADEKLAPKRRTDRRAARAAGETADGKRGKNLRFGLILGLLLLLGGGYGYYTCLLYTSPSPRD